LDAIVSLDRIRVGRCERPGDGQNLAGRASGIVEGEDSAGAVAQVIHGGIWCRREGRSAAVVANTASNLPSAAKAPTKLGEFSAPYRREPRFEILIPRKPDA